MVNQHSGNHGLRIFWYGRIGPWALPSRSDEDIAKLISAYNSRIIAPRGSRR